MKKNISRLLAFALIAFVFQSCKKETTEGFTHITTYAVIELQGDAYESITVGENFEDAGAIATEGETPLDVTVKGSVDNTTPGMYELVYSAVNGDGFAGSASRYVAVLPEAVTGESLAGGYTMGANAGTMTELAPGFYRFSNIWPPNSIPMYVLSTDGVDGTLPEISSPYGPVYGTMKLTGNNLEFVVDLPTQGITGRSLIWVKN